KDEQKVQSATASRVFYQNKAKLKDFYLSLFFSCCLSKKGSRIVCLEQAAEGLFFRGKEGLR
ncbi:hypothetical protein DHL47_12810, partial [Streptococcus panodentis]|nr:hypothetical protein [Streptococcus panodentis]